MPKRSHVLSIAEVKKVSSIVGDHSVGGVTGLTLRVVKAKDGALNQYWVFRKRGKDGFFYHIGPYDSLSLKEARDVAMDLLTNGKPEKKDSGQEEQKERLTVGEVYTRFFDWKLARGDWKRGPEARYREQHRFEKHLLPPLKNVKVSACTYEDVARAFRPIWTEYPATCDRLHQALYQLFTWATVVEKIRPGSLANPASLSGIAPLLPNEKTRKAKKNFPFLQPDQIPPFFKSLMGKAEFFQSARMLAFSILTCSRAANVRFLKWAQIDLDGALWEIPASEMKISANGQHIVPLSSLALQILKEQKAECTGELVFPSRTGTPLSDAAMTMLIRRMSEEEVRAGREGWIDREASKQEGRLVVAVQHAIARASFETWAHGEQKDPRIIALCLHHSVDTKLKSAYDRDTSLEAKRQLLEEWADFCNSAD